MRRHALKAWLAAAALAAAGGGLVWLARLPRSAGEPAASERADDPQPERPTRPASAPTADAAPEPWPTELRWLAFGGGAEPASNQVGIEQDFALANEVLGAGGVILYAGGPGSAVQELDAELPHGLQQQLGAIFDPRAGRRARYRPTVLAPQGAARTDAVLSALQRAREGQSDEPLIVYVAGHGEGAAAPRDNFVALWGDDFLTVADLATALDHQPNEDEGHGDQDGTARELALVMTTCFSGGFSELAFAQADPTRGPARGRCGLFATTWDRVASGCDSNPDRQAQESYSIHFLNALRGRSRGGEEILAAIDLDGDGRVSLAEAHAHMRIASRSFSVPTSTSERWLRHLALTKGLVAGDTKDGGPVEERAVAVALGRALGLTDAAAARTERERLRALLEGRERELAELREAVDEAFGELRIALLARWPVLEDPYHPLYARTLADERDALLDFLATSPAAQAFDEADAELHSAQLALEDMQMDAARVERLVRAHDSLALAIALEQRGGPDMDQYRRLMACERAVPRTAGRGAMRIVVCGTGTEIGKTHVGCALAHHWTAAGRRVAALKPIESGIADDGDWAQLGHAAHDPVRPLYAFLEPISPHLCARREGVTIELERIVAWVAAHAGDAAVTLVETAGGLFSPLSGDADNATLAAALAPDVMLLVAPDRLGVLHDVTATCRALGAITARLTIALSTPAAHDASTGSNAAELAQLGIASDVVVFPRASVTAASTQAAAARLAQQLMLSSGR